MILPTAFFARPTAAVARELIGMVLCRHDHGHVLAARIVETEAYLGPEDRASHASARRSKRARVMYGPPGHVYVYRIYGIHYCLNLVAESEGIAGAVLVRAAEPLDGIARMLRNRGRQLPPARLTSGPGCLCRAFAIDTALNGEPLQERKLWVEDRGVRAERVQRGPRIGVGYAGEWAEKPLRFFDPASAGVSGTRAPSSRPDGGRP